MNPRRLLALIVYCASRAVIWVTVAVLAVLGACKLAHGAPVPPPPRLTDERLVGRWQEEWGASYTGTVWFNADHTYVYIDDTMRHRWWVGAWRVENGALVLLEQTLDTRTGETNGVPLQYEIRFTGRYPDLTGTVGAGTRFRLSR